MTQAHAYPRPSVAPRPTGLEILALLFEEFDRRQHQTAREVCAQLLAEREAAAAEAERNEKLLDKDQTAEMLGGVAKKTVDAWRERGILPSHRIGGRVFFKMGEVLAALQAHTQPDGRRKYARRATNKKA
jgi:hypothetical protein